MHIENLIERSEQTMFQQNNDEIMVVFDPTTTDPELIATIYSIMKEECEDLRFARIPKPKNKSSYSCQ